jgi:hypothetical protein
MHISPPDKRSLLMDQNLTLDPALNSQFVHAEPPKAATALAYSLLVLGAAATIAWSGLLVWMATKGFFWLIG